MSEVYLFHKIILCNLHSSGIPVREVKHLAVDAAHTVAVAVDSMTASTNEKHQLIVEIAKYDLMEKVYLGHSYITSQCF
eukprot:COSAG01_NODE_50539_length_362_cov_1.650190_1_plen_79_part_00